MGQNVHRSRISSLASETEMRLRARRILKRITFVNPEQISLREVSGEATPGTYDNVCLNVGFLLALSVPIPAPLRRKHKSWIRAVRERQRGFFLALAPFGERHISKVDVEECLRKLRGGAAQC